MTTQRRFHSQSGFTLIEVLVTALMVMLMAAGTATALVATSHASGDEQFRSEADELAAQDQDQLRGLSDEQLDAVQDGAAPHSHQVPIGGITFTVTSTASFTSATGNGGGCTAGATAFYEIASTVSWSEGANPESIVENSLLTRPVVGDLLVQVTDQSNNPLSGVSVVASGASRQSAQTNSSGCTVFAGLTPDDYNLAFSKPGYVDINGNTSPTSTGVAVGPSGGAPVSEQLGPASGPINATFHAATGGGTGEADGLSWDASGMTTPLANPLATSTTAPTSTTATSATSLYPTSYAVWGGRCPGQEPPSGLVASATVSAGQAKSATVAEPTLAVTSVTDTTTVTSGSGKHQTTTTSTKTVKPTDVVLTYADGTGCTDSWAATLTPASTMPSTGWLANPGQPYALSGDLTVCADYKDPSTGTYYAASMTSGNTSFTAANTVPTIAINESTASAQCKVS